MPRRYSCRCQLRRDEPSDFLALATDYDGTLAHDGAVDRDTLAAVRRLKNSGRRLILVTGRELPELQRACPEFTVCDLIVVENGAVPYEPGTGRETVLAPAPREAFVARLRERGVHPLSVGRSIVASREPMQDIVLETVRELGASSCRLAGERGEERQDRLGRPARPLVRIEAALRRMVLGVGAPEQWVRLVAVAVALEPGEPVRDRCERIARLAEQGVARPLR